MIEQYIPVLAMIAVGVLFGLVSAKAHEWLGPHRPGKEKLTTYESGMAPVSSAHERFSVKFYLVAMLFILFDIEVVFMFPWAAVFRDLPGNFALGAMLLFIVTLLVGYVYIVKKGALKWD